MKQILLLKFIIASTCIYRFNGFRVHFDNGSEFEARVEIQYNDDEERAHTVCDSGWNRNDTRVMSCRQLGPESVEESANATDEAYYEEGNYTIWFNSTSCNGTELALEQCLHSEWESDHEPDAGAICSSSNAPNNYNETKLFSCNIDFQQQSSEDGENIYSTMPATAVKGLKSIRIVLSGYNNTVIIINNNNTTIINNNINNSTTITGSLVSCADSFVWPFIISAVAAAISATAAFITCLCAGLHKLPKDARKILSWVRRLCKTQSNDDTDELETGSGSDTESEIPESHAFTEQQTDNSDAVSGYNTYSRADNGEEEYTDMIPSQVIDNDGTIL